MKIIWLSKDLPKIQHTTTTRFNLSSSSIMLLSRSRSLYPSYLKLTLQVGDLEDEKDGEGGEEEEGGER